MNTDKLIPIDFSRNITPFVPGDVYWNNFLELEFTMDQQEADGFNNADPESEFNTYFIISFADRPNTGTQPVGDNVVGDNVVVDYVMYCNSGGAKRSSDVNWANNQGRRFDVISWKPNHAAMLKQWQESQLKKDSDMVPQVKPVFTKAMADGGFKPPIGSDVELFYDDLPQGVATAMYIGERSIFLNHNSGREQTARAEKYTFKPIQTDEEKAIDAMCHAMEMQNGSPMSVYKKYSAPVIEAIKAGKIHGVKWVGE